MSFCRYILRRERMKQREKLATAEQDCFLFVNCIYIDGRKDTTLVSTKKGQQYYHKLQMEEHYVVVEEPCKRYDFHAPNQCYD